MTPRRSKVTPIYVGRNQARRPRRHVLVVEDDYDCREVLRMALEHEGYVVSVAGNGLEALERVCASDPPDVVVTDLNMPVMDGWAFLAEKCKSPKTASIPVIVVSAVALLKRLPDPPGLLVLTKPIDFERLITAIKRFCDARNGTASAG